MEVYGIWLNIPTIFFNLVFWGEKDLSVNEETIILKQEKKNFFSLYLERKMEATETFPPIVEFLFLSGNENLQKFFSLLKKIS